MTKRTTTRAAAWVQSVLSAPAVGAVTAARAATAGTATAGTAAETAAAESPVVDAGPTLRIGPATAVGPADGTGPRPVRVVRVRSLCRRTPAAFRAAAAGLVAAVAWPAGASAAPTQEDVFRSIQHNVGGSGGGDGSGLVTFLIALAGLVLLLVVASQWKRKGAAAPRALNHQGRLMREVLRAVPIRGREVRQLRTMAEHAAADRPLASPLTLLLCPSVMARTIQSKRLKVDRRALAAVARKAGLEVVRK